MLTVSSVTPLNCVWLTTESISEPSWLISDMIALRSLTPWVSLEASTIFSEMLVSRSLRLLSPPSTVSRTFCASPTFRWAIATLRARRSRVLALPGELRGAVTVRLPVLSVRPMRNVPAVI